MHNFDCLYINRTIARFTESKECLGMKMKDQQVGAMVTVQVYRERLISCTVQNKELTMFIIVTAQLNLNSSWKRQSTHLTTRPPDHPTT
jgi:hypothetical protein